MAAFGFAATLAGGLAFFLYGLSRARSGLERASGGRLRALLALLTKRPVAAAGAGFAATLVTQSSSAVAVILVGMVSSGLMGSAPAVAILLGADLATTLTVQVIAFEISSVSLAGVAAGALLVLTARGRSARRLAGDVLFGFGLVFYGMHLMKTAAAPLAGSAAFVEFLAWTGKIPLLGIAAGAVATAVVQSSGATVGLVLALAQAGALGDEPLRSAVPIVLGANIGTAATGLIASLGADREGKRVAVAHLIEKIIGVAVMYPLIGPFSGATAALTRWTGGGAAREVANAHTLFNAGKLVAFLPLARLFAHLARRILPPGPEPSARLLRFLTDTSKDTPDIILVKVSKELAHTAGRVRDILERSLDAFEDAPLGEVDAVCSSEGEIGALHEGVVAHLRGLTLEELSDAQAREVERLLYVARDLEQAGDMVCGRLAVHAARKIETGTSFSVEGRLDFKRLGADVASSLAVVEEALTREGAAAPEPESDVGSRLREVIAGDRALDERVRELERAHFLREAAGVREAVETGAVFTNAVGEIRRIHLLAASAARTLLGRSSDAPPASGGYEKDVV